MMNNHTKPKKNNDIFLHTVATTMVAEQMINRGDSLLVGVSGGVDSVVLLATLRELAEKIGIARLSVAHLNHGLRGKNADRDAEFVAALAEKWSLSFYLDCADVAEFAEKQRLSVEDAARRLRYDFLHNIANKDAYDKIATGHHADDNAEQILMNLLRGSGPSGLAGIPPVREGIIIRPLIALFRKDISAFAKDRDLTFREDETNTNTRYLRNRIRHQLLPMLARDYNPNIADTLNRTARVFQEEKRWHQTIIAPLLDQSTVSTDNGKTTLSVNFLTACPRAVQRRLVRKAIETITENLHRITFDHVESLLVCLDNHQDFSLDLPRQVRVTRAQDNLIFYKTDRDDGPLPRDVPFFSYTLFEKEIKNTIINIDESNMAISFSVLKRTEVPEITACDTGLAFFDVEKLTCPLTIRNMRPGDRFSPLGMTGTQKVSDFFTNNKVPRSKRDACALLVSGETIIWVAGFRTAEVAKVTETTRKVLKTEIIAGENRQS